MSRDVGNASHPFTRLPDDAQCHFRAVWMKRGKRDDHVVPGMKNKIQAAMARLMSDETRAKVHGSQIKPKH